MPQRPPGLVTPLWTILIPTVPSRADFLNRLLKELYPQLTPQVSILIDADDGAAKVGWKRQRLLESARSEYVCFFDDDDIPSRNYVSLILRALESRPDVVGFCGFHTINGEEKTRKKFRHSLEYKSWSTGPDGTHQRNPNHLNPMKREIALKAGFENMAFSEDRDFAMRVLPLLKTQVMIEEAIYLYLFRPAKPDRHLFDR